MTNTLKIKVCGMKYAGNRSDTEKLPVDYLGFIFYPKSKRFVGKNISPELFNTEKAKVAVFVNEKTNEIIRIIREYDFKYVQLHGNETPEVCETLKNRGLKIIKAFSVNDNFDFSELTNYESCADFFLFDTKTEIPGGSGKKFNWKILKKYTMNTPFFLSGGIGPGDAGAIKEFNHPKLYGIDLNSRFEDEPGLKNIEKLEEFINEIKN